MSRDGNDRIDSLKVEGHAGFRGPEDGPDLVCAAVSALVGYLGVTFSQLMPEAADLKVSDGFFELNLRPGESDRPEVSVLLEGWVRALRQLEENYVGWVKLEEKR